MAAIAQPGEKTWPARLAEELSLRAEKIQWHEGLSALADGHYLSVQIGRILCHQDAIQIMNPRNRTLY